MMVLTDYEEIDCDYCQGRGQIAIEKWDIEAIKRKQK
jgi:hypothetical protein